MTSLLLESEKERLLNQIEFIRQSGPVAPAYVFVTTASTVSPKGKTYYYARQVRQPKSGDKQTITPLGRVGSERHRACERSIARRDAIAELEQQLSLLTRLIERQQANASLVDRDFSEPKES